MKLIISNCSFKVKFLALIKLKFKLRLFKIGLNLKITLL